MADENGGSFRADPSEGEFTVPLRDVPDAELEMCIEAGRRRERQAGGYYGIGYHGCLQEQERRRAERVESQLHFVGWASLAVAAASLIVALVALAVSAGWWPLR